MGLLKLLILVSLAWLGVVLCSAEDGALGSAALSTFPIVSLSLLIYGLFMSPTTRAHPRGAQGQRDPLRWLMLTFSVLPLVVVLLKIVMYHQHAVSMDRVTLIATASLDLALLVALYLSFLPRSPTLPWRTHERRVLIVGSGNRARRLAETLTRWTLSPVYIVGYLDSDPARVNRSVLGYRVLGTIDDITSILKEHVIDEVVMAVPRAMIPEVERIARACEEEGVKFCFMADLFGVRVARTRLVEFGQIPVLTHEPIVQAEWKLTVKRLIDITVVVCALPVVLPLMGLVAIAIKLDSKGPVFFAHDRVGQNKRLFRMLKFRSMVNGADRMQGEVEHLNEAVGPIFKVANDPRITRVGWWLRRSSLDELPQIFHVLLGQMSLVGPRPMSTRDVEKFDEGAQRRRFSVKPGLTCLWQISGRSRLPFSEWLRLDLYYIEHWSLRLDLKILWRTIPAVLRGEGAV
jgi:exopolysaccharide biosynthesis polyprenyl glycosylphosphotransferase